MPSEEIRKVLDLRGRAAKLEWETLKKRAGIRYTYSVPHHVYIYIYI